MSLEEEPTTPEPQPSETPPPTQPSTKSEGSLIGEGEPKVEPAPAPPAPEFDFAEVNLDGFKALLPEGADLNEDAAGKFLEALNGAKSRSDIAKAVVEIQSQLTSEAEAAAVKAWDDTQNAWKDETRADKTFGGDKLESSLAQARQLVEDYGGSAEEVKALKEFIAFTGVGNSIHMVRLLNNIAAVLPKEASPVEGAPQPTEKSRAERLFGT